MENGAPRAAVSKKRKERRSEEHEDIGGLEGVDKTYIQERIMKQKGKIISQ